MRGDVAHLKGQPKESRLPMPSERKPNRRNANDDLVDAVNRRLLLELQADARLSLAELGRQILGANLRELPARLLR